jgi:hypothetical protein
MADHLPLPPGRPLSSRRRRGGPVEPRAVARGTHAGQLRDQLRQIDSLVEAEPEPGVEELDTRIVLKLKGATRLQSGPFRGLQLTKLGEGRGWTYAVLSSRESRDLLAEVLSEYGQSEQGAPVDWGRPQDWASCWTTSTTSRCTGAMIATTANSTDSRSMGSRYSMWSCGPPTRPPRPGGG